MPQPSEPDKNRPELSLDNVADKEGLFTRLTTGMTKGSKNDQTDFALKRLAQQYLTHISQSDCSKNTLKNYLADLRKYFAWRAETENNALYTGDARIAEFSKSLSKAGLSPSTVRRVSTVARLFNEWCVNEGLVSPPLQPILDHGHPKERKRTLSRHRWGALFPGAVGLAMLLVGLTLGYKGFVLNERSSINDLSGQVLGVTPPRALSFQARLLNDAGNPVTAATDFVFQIWSDPTGGSSLWSSGTCSIDPDGDGIFSTNLGSVCGSAIADTVFANDASTYLEITVGGEVLDPRQPIAATPYALNADSLDGVDSSSFLRSDTADSFTSGTLTLDAATALDINGGLSVADLDISFDGASTTFSVTGAYTLNTGGAITLGDGGDTVYVNSSDWDVSTTGDLSGIGTIAADGNITITKADPALILNVVSATDTDYWLGVQDDAGGDDDDLFQIGEGSTPGTDPILTINTTGYVGIGTSAPLYTLDVRGGDIYTNGDMRIAGDDLFMTTNTANYFLMADGTNYNPTSPSDARTGLGLTAGGAGDIWVEKAGDTMSGNLAMGGYKVTGLAAASSNGDAVRYEQLHDALTIVDTTSVDLALTGQQLSATVLPAGVDHNSLLNYSADRHFLQTDITNISTALSTGLVKVTNGTGALTVVTDNSSNWNTAYGWGNHASAGYLTAEADTLATVTGRGATTSTASVFSTSLSTPSLISTGAIGITPASGSNLNISLATTGDLAVNTSQLYVDTSAGNVGIGTTNPWQDKLVINGGGVLISGTFTTTISSGEILGVNGSDVLTRSDTQIQLLNDNYWQSLAMFTNGTEKMRLSSTGGLSLGNSYVGTDPGAGKMIISGNVGIGDTSPAAALTVGSGDLFQVNSSGAIAAAAGITSSGTINFSGLTASKAVFTDGSKNLTSSGTLGVDQGGIGTTTLASGGILYGNGASAIGATAVLTDGQLLIGDGSGAPTLATLTQGTGMSITNGSGSISLATTLGASIAGSEVDDDTLDYVDFEDTLDLDANLTTNQTTYTSVQNFTGDTTTGLTYNANSLTTGTALSLASTSTAGGASGSSKVLNIARSGTNSNASHTAYGLYSAVTNTGTTSTNIAGYLSASGATNNYGLIVANGSVGIGTTAPGAKLDVDGNLMQSVTHGDNFKLWLSAARNGGGAGGVGLYSWISEPSQTWTGAGIARNISNTSGYARENSSLTAQMIHFTEPGNIEFSVDTAAGSRSTPLTVANSGNVGVGITAPTSTFKLHVQTDTADGTTFDLVLRDSNAVNNLYVRDDGLGYLRAASWSYGSDRRLKENINYFSSGLEVINQLRPAKFDYIDNAQKNQFGFIAQDVQPIIPEAVSIADDETGMLGLKTEYVIPFLVNAVQELDHKITALREVGAVGLTAETQIADQLPNGYSLMNNGLIVDGYLGVGRTNSLSQFHVHQDVLQPRSALVTFSTKDLPTIDKYFLQMVTDTTDGADIKFDFAMNGNAIAAGSWTGGGTDVAEWVEANEEVLAGDVLAFDQTGKVVKAKAGQENRLAGVYSTNPGIVTGGKVEEKTENKALLTLSGSVPVRVDASAGWIKAGDLLTASLVNNGTASKATAKGWIIGRALEDQVSDRDVLTMFVGVSWYPGPAELTLQDVTLSSELAQTMQDLKVNGDTVLNASLTTYGNVVNYGLTTVNDIFVHGGLHVGDLSINAIDGSINRQNGALAIQNSDQAGDVEFFKKSLVIRPNGDIDTRGEVNAESLQLSNSARGEVEVTAKSVRVEKTWVEAPVSIQLTPSYNTYVWVTEIDNTGFSINVDVLEPTAKVYWLAIW